MQSWAQYQDEHPNGLVMTAPNGAGRYGANPYLGYDRAEIPFGYFGDLPDNGIPALARVVRVGQKAWPLQRIAKLGVLTEHGVKITWQAGQASAVDHFLVSQGRDVGAIRVFDMNSGKPLVHDVIFAFAFHNLWPDGEWVLHPPVKE